MRSIRRQNIRARKSRKEEGGQFEYDNAVELGSLVGFVTEVDKYDQSACGA